MTQIFIHVCVLTYEYMHTYTISMNTFKRLSRSDIEIHEVGHQECLTVDGNITYH
jgi:hypothetical protein